MSLGRDKWLLDGRQTTDGTYHLILTARILRAFQRVTMTVGNNGKGVHNVILGAGNGGVGVCDVVRNGGNGYICVYCRCLLGAGS